MEILEENLLKLMFYWCLIGGYFNRETIYCCGCVVLKMKAVFK